MMNMQANKVENGHSDSENLDPSTKVVRPMARVMARELSMTEILNISNVVGGVDQPKPNVTDECKNFISNSTCIYFL